MASSGPEPTMNKSSSKSKVIKSIRSCSLSGMKVSKDKLRQKIRMPEYLRLAISDAIKAKNINAGKHHFDANKLADFSDDGGDNPPPVAPESPLVVFVNSKSGGRHGSDLLSKLPDLMGEEQVLDLQNIKPHEFVQYGLACLENFASLGDTCAKETRERLRIVVAGGDGTVGWVLGCLGELHKQGRDPVPPTAIIPLGTGNDLSRSFGWGGSFPFKWKTAIKRTLDRALHAPLGCLDSWELLISMPAGEELETPHALKKTEVVALDQDLDIDGELPEKVSCYQGVFYNYFSIGMDAQVAYGFHNLRNEKPYLAKGRIANKIIYSGYSAKQGWFFHALYDRPELENNWKMHIVAYFGRGLNNILRMHIKRLNSPTWELIPLPSSIRSIVALNLHSYASGRNPWGNLKPEYLEKKGFVEANSDDGLLEIFGFKQGWHASFVMVDLISAKHIAQAAAIRFEIRGGMWEEGFHADGCPDFDSESYISDLRTFDPFETLRSELQSHLSSLKHELVELINREEATLKVPLKDPKKKDDKKDEDLSEEDLALMQQLEMYVERVQDADQGLQKVALESMRYLRGPDDMSVLDNMQRGTRKLHEQTEEVQSLQGYSKQEISELTEQMRKSYEEQLKRITEMF
ncbi:unnamed protein product [Lactuca virosa]|uniref:Diacylglycerol kinase n=1 Tax=Lactuca virosa TaxID=75947 RepID=A0AAU9MKI8_9ASTR|nr:unnamed protein product [Lactuca virosa]